MGDELAFTNPLDNNGEGASEEDGPELTVEVPEVDDLAVAARVQQYEAKGIIEPVFVDVSTPKPSAAAGEEDEEEGEGDGAGEEPEKQYSICGALWNNFLGHCPLWYKLAIVTFLCANIPIRYGLGTKICAWAVLLEFIFTLACALHCYPLQPGGLIVIEAFALGLAKAETMKYEVEHNLNVLLLVAFMVACIHFLKNLLLWVFTELLIQINSKTVMSVLIMFLTAVLSAFLDALSVAAVLVSVCTGALGVYFHVVADADLPMLDIVHHDTMSFELVPHAPAAARSHKTDEEVGDILSGLAERSRRNQGAVSRAAEQKSSGASDPEKTAEQVLFEQQLSSEAVLKRSPSLDTVLANDIAEPVDADAYALHVDDIKNFRSFLRSLLMHGAIGTTLGGCSSGVGQPQNLVIARYLGWDFIGFFAKMLPVSGLVLPLGLMTCVALESSKSFGYGEEMPAHVRKVLAAFANDEYGKMGNLEKAELGIQGLGALILVFGLALHVTEVGFVGLGIMVFLTSFNGITEEYEVAHAFLEAMPFVSLLVVFFGVVAVIQDQQIFTPIIDGVLELEEGMQPGVLFFTNGVLSMVSDNVFVATVFIKGVGE
jgi:Na+/H+ antiporter NhaB